LEFDVVFGFLGEDAVINDSFDPADIKIFNNLVGGTFDLIDPQISVFIENTFGIDISLLVEEISYIYPGGPAGGDGLFFKPGLNPLYPAIFSGPATENYNDPILSINYDTIVLDTSVCGIRDMIRTSPSIVNFDVGAITANPSDTDLDPRTSNFIKRDSRVSIDMRVELPLYGSAVDFTASDTLELEFADSLANPIKSATIRLKTTNYFPWAMEMRAWVVDENYAFVDTLLGLSTIIASGIVDDDGIVIAPTESISNLTVTRDQVDNLIGRVKYIVVEGLVETTDHGTVDVQMLSTYRVEIEVGVLVESQITTILNESE